MINGLDATTLAAITLIFVLGGLTKGIVGMGLPLVSVPLLSHFVPIPTAVALMTLPIVASNFLQMFSAGVFVSVLRRFWPVILSLVLGIAFGTRILVAIDERALYLFLGVTVIAFVVVDTVRIRSELPPRHEAWAGPAVGLAAGVLGGLSTFFGPPLAMYLVALRVPKDVFVTAIALMFFTGGVPLMLSLAAFDVLGGPELIVSAGGIVPVVIGMFAGQKVRARVPEKGFRTAILVALVLIGLNLVRRAFAG